jgi:hypothetical protein
VQRNWEGKERRWPGACAVPLSRQLCLQVGEEDRPGYSLHDRELPVADSQYGSLKVFVSRKGGLRLAMHAPLRDRLVELVVQEWPVGCDPANIPEVVEARVRLRLREQYSSAIAIFFLTVFLQLVIKIVLEWWFNRQANRVLMAGWATTAQEGR